MTNKSNLLIAGMFIMMNVPVLALETVDTLDSQQQQIVDIFQRIKHKQDSVKHYRDSIEQAVKVRCIPGYPVPNFQFQDVDGRVVSLKALKGKYVLIDVWATWCGPCCNEIPYLQGLEKIFRKKKIIFMSISIDSNVDDWKRMVKERKLGGIQLHYGGDRRLLDEFGVETIPRFILLDKKGKVVEAYMTRPSEDITKETLENLKGI